MRTKRSRCLLMTHSGTRSCAPIALHYDVKAACLRSNHAKYTGRGQLIESSLFVAGEHDRLPLPII